MVTAPGYAGSPSSALVLQPAPGGTRGIGGLSVDDAVRRRRTPQAGSMQGASAEVMPARSPQSFVTPTPGAIHPPYFCYSKMSSVYTVGLYS